MSNRDHLTDDLLVRLVDDELSGAESILVESHLSQCEECTQRYHELRSVCIRVESAVTAIAPEISPENFPENFNDQRDSLSRALELRERQAAFPRPRKALRRFGWGMAIAATLAAGALLGPQWTHRVKFVGMVAQDAQTGAAFEVDGERFIALPYSNPDLPLTAPHIVQMQVPVSSLADAGIVFEPVSNEVSAPDRSVLADVLLGIDGQPLGVHVLDVE